MQKLESVSPLIEKIAKQKCNLDNIIADICQRKNHCRFVGPELGHNNTCTPMEMISC